MHIVLGLREPSHRITLLQWVPRQQSTQALNKTPSRKQKLQGYNSP